MVKVAAFGMGRIGGEAAYISAVNGFADELVLYDIMPEFLHAQKLDIMHARDVPISTNLSDMKDADYCIFSAGYSRSPNVKTRADLFDKNLPIAREAAELLKGFSGKLIVITNPMDVFTWYFAKHAGLDEGQVVGFGGLLDSRRFTVALSSMGIKEEGMVLGEHGENQVPLFSNLSVDVPEAVREEVLLGLRGSSMPVIKGKGGTVFGPAYHIVNMMQKIERGEEFICSLPANGAYGIDGCSIGLPAKVTRNGAKINENLQLDDWEAGKLNAAAEFLTGLCRRV
ncbi:MAG TPA: lactate dehydrogenase [Methanocorpusculum sp.]|jgi:malate dehydrogenase|nr:lactate dehydrogenase [Methanocorpusculum sp.]MBR5008279.1 lactate dehydrogenase [Methanocorpusculum sp.]MBR5142645.1 lactate dehydrogenase [Methanocorpusculum sp.]MBR5450821.1 lactate dehydrogenase [Methanocorpusculum sp.]HJJ64719.1 lactate dehydrogenase [Methanocorpusculum sp.]